MSNQHRIVLGDLELVPHLSGAIFVPAHHTLIISDLHLEQGTSLARRGIHVPPFDTASTLAMLAAVISVHAPKRLVFLGDSFHDGDGEARLQGPHFSQLRQIALRQDTIWIVGNHDPEPPQLLGGVGADEIMLGGLTLRHEPKRHLKDECEIAGHLHPGCGLSLRGRHVRGKCFVADAKRLIMPAFGAYTGALSIRSDAFHGLFEAETTKIWMIGKSGLHRFSL
ncbi:MAG: ligase-associated DNA damage response endonuclease PdeM [Alphaproteobacteria bacterium]|nr:ligase-associated DNA damage response endonuclease PdeM [Alphaproteobacteria bacterium]